MLASGNIPPHLLGYVRDGMQDYDPTSIRLSDSVIVNPYDKTRSHQDKTTIRDEAVNSGEWSDNV